MLRAKFKEAAPGAVAEGGDCVQVLSPGSLFFKTGAVAEKAERNSGEK